MAIAPGSAVRSPPMRPLFALALALSLAACGSKPKPATTPEAAATPVETEATSTDDESSDDAGLPKQTAPDDDAKADPCGGGE